MSKLSMLVVVCALALAATASAGTSRYRGEVDPSGRLKFKLDKDAGKRRVLDLKWTAVPVDCGARKLASSGRLVFRVPVKRSGAFHAEAVLGDKDEPDAKAEIRGTIDGRDARGRIALSGTKLPIDGRDSGADCASGKLGWTASR